MFFRSKRRTARPALEKNNLSPILTSTVEYRANGLHARRILGAYRLPVSVGTDAETPGSRGCLSTAFGLDPKTSRRYPRLAQGDQRNRARAEEKRLSLKRKADAVVESKVGRERERRTGDD